ncbi:hypothetical protein HPP92_022262 [Vanilla planifolia]|uniref:TF-B3 domain-containing protein n=1 Tax=Vanilla planifolia TaxID=51239 RepID=A0A835UDF6_VANPL|nr:hypothetical protein HPP92_022262 [Vanilla planifolia]
MEFTQGRRDNRYYPEDEDEERDDCIAEGDGGGCGRGGVGGLHPFLTVSSSPSPSSSSGAIVVDWTDQTGASTSATAPPAPAAVVEKEHMFEKIVTPSDVGKLNRLVIPKQHAEKYFPLDSSTHEKGLLLNFEDRNGKPWRFRYSYWNSSQSYVMTKGWSRFVKEKRLDAGDTVSFGRGVGEDARDRLFIDWKRRPDPHLDPPASLRIPHFSYNPPLRPPPPPPSTIPTSPFLDPRRLPGLPAAFSFLKPHPPWPPPLITST